MSQGQFTRHNLRSAKLTASKVAEIRYRYNNNLASQGQLSREFQVSIGQIGRIVRGESWQQFGMQETEEQIADQAQQSMERMRRMLAELPVADETKEVKEFIPPPDMPPPGQRLYQPPLKESPEIIAQRAAINDELIRQKLAEQKRLPRSYIDRRWEECNGDRKLQAEMITEIQRLDEESCVMISAEEMKQ